MVMAPDASQESPLHTAVSVRVLPLHDLVPDRVYPESQVGVHVDPLASKLGHEEASPLAIANAASVQAWLHTTVFVNTRLVHDIAPDSTYPASHVGTQDVPLTRVSVQLPTAPLTGGRDASHALSLRVHPRSGRVWSLPPVNLAFHAFAFRKIKLDLMILDVSQPTGMVLNASVSRNIICISVTELTSHLDRCWLKASALKNMLVMSVTLEVSQRTNILVEGIGMTRTCWSCP